MAMIKLPICSIECAKTEPDFHALVSFICGFLQVYF